MIKQGNIKRRIEGFSLSRKEILRRKNKKMFPKKYNLSISNLNKISIDLQSLVYDEYVDANMEKNKKPIMYLTGVAYADYYGRKYITSKMPLRFKVFLSSKKLEELTEKVKKLSLSGVNISICSFTMGENLQFYDKEISLKADYEIEEEIL